MAVLKKFLNKKEVVKLKIPADPGFIKLARLILSANLRQKEVDEEEIEDLKLVLSELLAKAIEARLIQDCICFEISFEIDTVEIVISDLEEFKPGELFNSPYLNFETISGLVDDFDLKMPAEKQGVNVVIRKRFHF